MTACSSTRLKRARCHPDRTLPGRRSRRCERGSPPATLSCRAASTLAQGPTGGRFSQFAGLWCQLGPNLTRAGSRRRSMRSSWRSSRRKGLHRPRSRSPHLDSPRSASTARLAPLARGGRGVRRTIPRPTPTRSWSTGCWPRPHYGERWGRHWLDVVRFGESEGYETNSRGPMPGPIATTSSRPSIAIRRSPLRARAACRRRAASEGQPGSRGAATGFLVGGTHDIVGNQTVEGMRQQRVDDLDDIITATGTPFWGLPSTAAGATTTSSTRLPKPTITGSRRSLPESQHAARDHRVADSESRRAKAAEAAAELARIELQLDAFEPLGPSRHRRRDPPHGRTSGGTWSDSHQCRRGWSGSPILATNNRSEPCIDELEVFLPAPLAPGTWPWPRQGARLGLVGVSRRRNPQDRASDRWPGREQP